MTACKDQALPLCLKVPVWNADIAQPVSGRDVLLFQYHTTCGASKRAWELVRAEGQRTYLQNIRGVETLPGARLSCPRGCNCPLSLHSPRDPVGMGGWAEDAVRRIWSHMKPQPAQAQRVLTSSCLLPCCCLAGLEEGFHHAQILLISQLGCQLF